MKGIKTVFLRKFMFLLAVFILPLTVYPVSITIDTSNERAAISPLIYGTNQQMEGNENLTCMRFGGNRVTGYNWENNASNAGSDWYHSSDNFMCGALENPVNTYDCANVPGAVLNNFLDYCALMGYEPLITLPMAGYVAADKDGNVLESEAAPSARWKTLISKKGSAFSLPPDTLDGYVYADEEVAHIVNRYGLSAAGGVRFYELDNEGDLWNSTHVRIHPSPVGASEWVTRGAELAKAVKDVDPQAQIMGPVFFGIWSMMSQGDDWNTVRGTNTWYVPYYLQQMKAQSDADGRRLLDVLDLHYYSEAREGLYPPFDYNSGQCRITDPACNSAEAIQARLQAPRSLWDPSYIENSSAGQWCGTALPIIPKVQAAIDADFPGTKIAVTEFGFGGGSNFSGGIAMADTLGIFGKYGVYIATMWNTDYGLFHSAAYKLFRNYDGANSTYGDTKVSCESGDNAIMSAYASISGTDETALHVIVLNKSSAAQNADFVIDGSAAYQSGEAYGFGGSDSTITLKAAPVVTGNAFSYSVPAYSAYHFVFYGAIGPTNTPTPSITPGGPALTFTGTYTYTHTSTSTYTATVTPTPGAGIDIYDGDTAGMTITDGTANNSADGGGISQGAAGNPGNGMVVSFASIQSWWQQHDWALNTPVNTGAYTLLEFDIISEAGIPNGLRFGLDWNLTDWSVDVTDYVSGGVINQTWNHVSIPVDTLLQGGTVIQRLIFVGNADNDYSVIIDNVRITGQAVQTPTYTYTASATETETAVNTAVNTPVDTATNTATLTPSLTPPPAITFTITATHQISFTATAVDTADHTATVTLTNTPVITVTKTTTVSPSNTAGITFTKTATRTNTATVTNTAIHTATETPAIAATFTHTPVLVNGLDELKIENVTVYPNPYTGDGMSVLFDITKSAQFVKFSLYTGSFRLIKEAKLNITPGAGNKKAEISSKNFESLANGTYYCVISAEDGGKKAVSKINTVVIIRK
ncbi:MAG: glycoside hydrolase family 44 protein [Candidatus Goldbacteria bacterium]|nr:glycoside hydrolase family 44 protein [Candidatus Goldiibacteriota bacterium]